MRPIPASEFGAVTVSEPGLYALCTGDISSPSATILVNATEGGDADVTVRVQKGASFTPESQAATGRGSRPRR